MREGAFDEKSDSTHHPSSRNDQDDLEMKPRFPAYESEENAHEASENNNNNNNNNEGGDCWGPFAPGTENGHEMPPRPEHFNPIVGLENLGNTCYANSVFQVLRFTPGFTAGLRHIVEQMEFVETKLQVLFLSATLSQRSYRKDWKTILSDHVNSWVLNYGSMGKSNIPHVCVNIEKK